MKTKFSKSTSSASSITLRECLSDESLPHFISMANNKKKPVQKQQHLLYKQAKQSFDYSLVTDFLAFLSHLISIDFIIVKLTNDNDSTPITAATT